MAYQRPHGVRFHQRVGGTIAEGGTDVACYHITSIGGGVVSHKSPNKGGGDEESVEKLHVLVIVVDSG